jgi:hypothetical protein
MNLLWGLVNALQLIVTLPLFNLDFPANALTLFSFLANLASFQVFPTDKLLFFFTFNDTA